MYSFKEVRKASKLEINGAEYRVAVLGNCATQLLTTALLGYAKLENINLSVYDADYDQIDTQLLDHNSETYKFQPGFILLYLSTERLYEEFMRSGIEERAKFADIMMSKIDHYWNLILNNCNARILQMNFTEINDRILGNYSAKISISFIYQIRRLNYLLEERMAQRNEIYPVDLLSIQILLGSDVFFNPAMYYNTKMTIDLNVLPYVAENIVDILKAVQGKIKKCVVLDLDNTLWGGIIGDDGLAGIEVGELGRGHAFTDFQLWLRQLKERGILLAVCSKNNEEIAKEPFEKHSEMTLRLSDISIFVANWEDKASNIKWIQKNLNIGMDSMVFIDDSSFERELVKSMIPEITVPELPEDPAEYLTYLQNLNLFETVSYSSEDKDRTRQYQAEFKRKELEQEFNSIDDYLKGLEMIGEVRVFDSLSYSRIAQLTQRSNQFNLRTVRYTEDDIQRIAMDERYVALYYTLRDKFGDHGIVAVTILEKRSSTELFIDTLLMSCRVLKRGMEEFIMNKLVDVARNGGYKTIRAEYIPTSKNTMVKDLHSTMGFTVMQDFQYLLDIEKYITKTHYIKEGMENE